MKEGVGRVPGRHWREPFRLLLEELDGSARLSPLGRVIANGQMVLLVLAGLLALGVALAATEAGQTLIGLVAARLDDVVSWIGRLFGGGA